MRSETDKVLDAERAFMDRLLDAVGSAVEDIEHEVAHLRSEGYEDQAQWVENAMRPLRKVHSGVEPDG